MIELKLVDTGEVLDIESYSLNYGIDSWLVDFSFSVADLNTLDKLTPPAGENFVKCEVTLGLETWILLCEKPSANETGFSYSVNARSISALLAEPHAEKITKTWSNTTAQTIALELYPDLNWEVLDWDIASYSADKIYPIDIIKYFADDIDAKLQTEPNGVLSVIYHPPCSPYSIETETPDYVLNNVFELGWTWINSLNDKTVLVTTETDSSKDDGLSLDSEMEGADLIIKIRTKPFNSAVTLSHRSTGFVSLFYEGELTEQVEEILTVQEGKASLSKNFDSLVSAAWQQDITGNLTYSANGDVLCDMQVTGFVKVVYLTRYQRYRAVKNGNIERTGFEAVSDTTSINTGSGLSLTCNINGGGQEGEAIIVKTLNTVETLLKRGAAYLWKNAVDFKEYSLETPYTGTALNCGKIARVNNEFNGYITAVSITGADSQAVTVLRPVF